MGAAQTKEGSDAAERLRRIEDMLIAQAATTARQSPIRNRGVAAAQAMGSVPPPTIGISVIDGELGESGTGSTSLSAPPPRASNMSPSPRNGRRVSGGKLGIKSGGMQASFIVDDAPGGGAPAVSAKSSETPKSTASRAAINAAKAKRRAFFEPMEFKGAWHELPRSPGVKCVWLACASLAIEYASGRKVRMEEILSRNHMALHYVSFPSVTLAELYDNVDEFIRSTPELKDLIRCEVATFDQEFVDESQDPTHSEKCGSGDRAPITTLMAFRKMLAAELIDEDDSCHIVNFDPYPVQEAELKSAQDEDEEATDGEVMNHKPLPPKQWSRRNQGHFCLITGFNQVLHTVSIAAPHLAEDGSFKLQAQNVPLQVFFQACCASDGYTKRPRGFVRIFKKRCGARYGVPSRWPITLLDGRDSRGMLSIALDIALAPHVVGLGMLHHLVTATLLTQTARQRQAGKGIQLRGIQVFEIVRKLQLPLGVFVNSSTKQSLVQAAAWYDEFLRRVGLADTLNIGLVRLSRRDDAEDGAVNIDEEDFRDFLSGAADDQETIVMLGFDANVAHNVKVATEPAHFGFVVGYDTEHEVVLMADVSVKKYRKRWSVPFSQMYNAVIGYGALVVSRNAKVAERFNGRRHVEELRTVAAVALPPTPAVARVFEFPRRNYSLTVPAVALNRLGHTCTLEDLIFNAGFHISFLLSEHLPLHAVQRALTYFCYYHADDKLASLAMNMDANNGDPAISKDDFIASVKRAASGDSAVIVNFAQSSLAKVGEVWNGANGGNFAMVTAYEATDDSVLLEDGNPEPYYRTWRCPVDVIVRLMREKDGVPDRARGFIVLRKGNNPRFMDALQIDHRRAQSFHPFKNPVSPHATAISLALSELTGFAQSQEDVLYAGGDGLDLRDLVQRIDFTAAVELARSYLGKATVPALGEVKLTAEPNNSTDDESFMVALASHKKCIVVIVYDHSEIFAFDDNSGSGAAVINRANRSDNEILVVDGSPTRNGAMWSRPVALVRQATSGILKFTLP